jgi:hypothetical protein
MSSIFESPSFLFFMGAIFLWQGIKMLIAGRRFLKKAVRAKGEITGKVLGWFLYFKLFLPRITFTTSDKRKITFTSKTTIKYGFPRKGARVNVLYDPKHPQKAEWDNLTFFWFRPLVMLCCATFFFLMAYLSHFHP